MQCERAPAALQWRQDGAVGHHQAGRQLPAHFAHSRCSLGHTGGAEEKGWPAAMAGEPARAQAPQRCSGCAGQSKCPNGVGFAGAQTRLRSKTWFGQTHQCSLGCLSEIVRPKKSKQFKENPPALRRLQQQLKANQVRPGVGKTRSLRRTSSASPR